MDDSLITRAIGYGIIVIMAYHILGIFIPLVTYAVIALVLFRLLILFLHLKQ